MRGKSPFLTFMIIVIALALVPLSAIQADEPLRIRR